MQNELDYSIKINEFEGPLDLLLHLIKQSNIDIYDISITEITKDYLDYINKMQELNIDVASSYLVMASELMVIKSRSLLPTNNEETIDSEEELTKEKLISKLVEYQKYKEVTSYFKEYESKRKEIYIKLPGNINNYNVDTTQMKGQSNVDILLEAFKSFLERQKYMKPLNTKVTKKEYSVKVRKEEIYNILKKEHTIKFSNLFDKKEKDYIIVTFLSILEMAKDNTLKIEQKHNFDEIILSLESK